MGFPHQSGNPTVLRKDVHMKRILSIFLACILLFSCFSFHTFAASAKNLQYEVSVGGQSDIYVQAGDEITVELYLNNVTDNGTYTITNHQTEIEYDSKFFEVTEEDVELVSGKATAVTLKTYSLGTTRVNVTGNTLQGGKATEFENRQLFARITFKVKEGLADGSYSVLTNKKSFAEDALSDADYTVSTQNLTVHIGQRTDYAVEVGLDEGDYVAGTKLVLVYSNGDMTFDYNGIQMFDVTGAGYQYDGKEDFIQDENTKVYALVADALAENTLDAYKAKITVDNDEAPVIDYADINDVNFSKSVTWDDIISVYAVAEHNKEAFQRAMSVVLKADTNHNKTVNIYDLTTVIKAVYGG